MGQSGSNGFKQPIKTTNINKKRIIEIIIIKKCFTTSSIKKFFSQYRRLNKKNLNLIKNCAISNECDLIKYYEITHRN